MMMKEKKKKKKKTLAQTMTRDRRGRSTKPGEVSEIVLVVPQKNAGDISIHKIRLDSMLYWNWSELLLRFHQALLSGNPGCCFKVQERSNSID